MSEAIRNSAAYMASVYFNTLPTSPDGTDWGIYGDSPREQWGGMWHEARLEDEGPYEPTEEQLFEEYLSESYAEAGSAARSLGYDKESCYQHANEVVSAIRRRRRERILVAVLESTSPRPMKNGIEITLPVVDERRASDGILVSLKLEDVGGVLGGWWVGLGERRGGGSKSLDDLEVDNATVKKVAAAVVALGASNSNLYDRRHKASKAAHAKIDKKAAPLHRAWIEAHAPSMNGGAS